VGKAEGIKTAVAAVADIVLPRVCVVCGTRLLECEKHICTCCMADFPFTGFEKVCHNPMADAFNAKIESGLKDSFEPYAFASALFYYRRDYGYSNITRRLKYKRAFAEGVHFSEILGEKLAAADCLQDVDAVVPVPLHWTRKWKRGYNQAGVIAGTVAEKLEAGFKPELLRRIRKTSMQAHVSGELRDKNVEGAFMASQDVSSYGHILLIDDVFTSGATLYSCFKAIREVPGAMARISIATLGFVDD